MLDIVQDLSDRILDKKINNDLIIFDLLFIEAKTQLFYPGNKDVQNLADVIELIQIKKKKLSDTHEPLAALHAIIGADLEKIGLELKKLNG